MSVMKIDLSRHEAEGIVDLLLHACYGVPLPASLRTDGRMMDLAEYLASMFGMRTIPEQIELLAKRAEP
jgi:hypothetical protein